MQNSPLGQYAPLVATVTSLLVIGGYVISLLFGASFGVTDQATDQLQSIALIAIGAVFGSAVSVNGWKQPLEAANTRLDAIGAPSAAAAHEIVSPKP